MRDASLCLPDVVGQTSCGEQAQKPKKRMTYGPGVLEKRRLIRVLSPVVREEADFHLFVAGTGTGPDGVGVAADCRCHDKPATAGESHPGNGTLVQILILAIGIKYTPSDSMSRTGSCSE